MQRPEMSSGLPIRAIPCGGCADRPRRGMGSQTPRSSPNPVSGLCDELTGNMSHLQWRESVSQHIDHIPVCTGLAPSEQPLSVLDAARGVGMPKCGSIPISCEPCGFGSVLVAEQDVDAPARSELDG